MPAPSFSKEQLKALGMPEDISEESLRSVIYTYGNQKIDMIIGMPAYWEQVKPEEAKENQCYFVLSADETNNTMFSISSYEETIKGGHEEDGLLAYVQDQWQTYSERLKTKAGYTLENIEEIKTIQVGRYVGEMIRFETVHPEGTRTINHFIIWATGKRIYWCTVSADPAYWVYAENSVLDMLKDFVTFDDVGK